MSKVTITIEDTEQGTEVQATFHGSLTDDPAHKLAQHVLQVIDATAEAQGAAPGVVTVTTPPQMPVFDPPLEQRGYDRWMRQ